MHLSISLPIFLSINLKVASSRGHARPPLHGAAARGTKYPPRTHPDLYLTSCMPLLAPDLTVLCPLMLLSPVCYLCPGGVESHTVESPPRLRLLSHARTGASEGSAAIGCVLLRQLCRVSYYICIHTYVICICICRAPAMRKKTLRDPDLLSSRHRLVYRTPCP